MASSAPQFVPLPDRLRDILLAHQEYLKGIVGRQPGDLSGQDLHPIDVTAYRLDKAVLKNANLSGANLTGTTLSDADVSGADLRDAFVTGDQARSAKGWLLARWSPDILNELGLPANHSDRVELKDFRGYTLPAANLAGLDLSEAALDEADLAAPA